MVTKHAPLAIGFSDDLLVECGCDEAGRGCLAGPVFAAAVVLPSDFSHPMLNDSKKMTEKQRMELRPFIEAHSLAWAVAQVSAQEIDEINILKASFLAMHRAIAQLSVVPARLLIDGNRFTPYPNINHECIVHGDACYAPIAAASVLAKTYRDDYMRSIASDYPIYDWLSNKGYPTEVHRAAVEIFGISPHHRKTFCQKFLNK